MSYLYPLIDVGELLRYVLRVVLTGVGASAACWCICYAAYTAWRRVGPAWRRRLAEAARGLGEITRFLQARSAGGAPADPGTDGKGNDPHDTAGQPSAPQRTGQDVTRPAPAGSEPKGMTMATEALLVMDVQNGIVGRYGDPGPLLQALGAAAAAARAAAVPVIYVRAAFREGAPEISPRNRAFSSLAGRGGLTETGPPAQVHPAVAPQPGDILVTKRRVSAFSGSDLEVVLRSLGIDALVLGGIAISGVVLSTLRQAADLDCSLTVLRDGCADADPQVHRLLLDKVPRGRQTC